MIIPPSKSIGKRSRKEFNETHDIQEEDKHGEKRPYV
jgi:hypothetical protein